MRKNTPKVERARKTDLVAIIISVGYLAFRILFNSVDAILNYVGGSSWEKNGI